MPDRPNLLLSYFPLIEVRMIPRMMRRTRSGAGEAHDGQATMRRARFVAVAKDAVTGMPDLHRASTSHVERKNGTLRQWCKKMTRLTCACSKKWQHHHAALALHFAYYNFCRIHRSLRVTPGMEAGITDHVWTLRELLTT